MSPPDPPSSSSAPPAPPVGAPAEFTQALLGVLPEARAYARFLTGNRAEADDLLQEATVRALAALRNFSPQGGTLHTQMRAWVFTIVRNTFYASRRRARVEREALAVQNPSEEAPATQQVQAELGIIDEALHKLPPLLREAIILVAARGLSYEEAAELCDVPVGTMKARVSRGRSKLALLLDHTTATEDEATAAT